MENDASHIERHEPCLLQPRGNGWRLHLYGSPGVRRCYTTHPAPGHRHSVSGATVREVAELADKWKSETPDWQARPTP